MSSMHQHDKCPDARLGFLTRYLGFGYNTRLSDVVPEFLEKVLG